MTYVTKQHTCTHTHLCIPVGGVYPGPGCCLKQCGQCCATQQRLRQSPGKQPQSNGEMWKVIGWALSQSPPTAVDTSQLFNQTHGDKYLLIIFLSDSSDMLLPTQWVQGLSHLCFFWTSYLIGLSGVGQQHPPLHPPPTLVAADGLKDLGLLQVLVLLPQLDVQHAGVLVEHVVPEGHAQFTVRCRNGGTGQPRHLVPSDGVFARFAGQVWVAQLHVDEVSFGACRGQHKKS